MFSLFLLKFFNSIAQHCTGHFQGMLIQKITFNFFAAALANFAQHPTNRLVNQILLIAQKLFGVITSYSIHYTKLYEADKIAGAYLKNRDRKILLELAESKILWERRIAILATFHFTKNGECEWTLKIAKKLLGDA